MTQKTREALLESLSKEERTANLFVGRIEEGIISLDTEWLDERVKQTQIIIAVQPENWNTFEFWQDMVIEDILHEPHLMIRRINDDGELTDLLCEGNAKHWHDD